MSVVVGRQYSGVPRHIASPLRARVAVAGVALVACAAAWTLASAAESRAAAPADAELARLMHMMAGLKFAMAAAALWFVDWRLTLPASSPVVSAYAAASALLAAGPALIWHPSSVLAGAIVFHAGLGLLLLLGWRDRDATGAMLARVVRDRARARRS